MSIQNSIILIGMMGSGKTTIGKLLSKELNFDFLDTDKILELKEQMSCKEIFKKKGENYFRTMEMQLLPSLKNTNTVIATGGGFPIYNDNFKKLNSIGTTIYLKTSAEELNRRTKIKSHRPLIKNKDSIREILYFRNSAYQKSRFTISTDFKSPQEIAATIISIIE